MRLFGEASPSQLSSLRFERTSSNVRVFEPFIPPTGDLIILIYSEVEF